ncbi:MAG: NAD-dependent malic enzyme, partial [Armatimonadota bacterium]
MAPSPGNSILIKMKYPNTVGKLAQITDAIAKAGGSISYVEVLESNRTHIVRDITIDTTGLEQAENIIESVKSIPEVEILEHYDCTFKIHEAGKLDVVSKRPLKNIIDLSMAYTPGVARVCTAISENPELAKCYTIKSNTVAVLSDGTAVLGLGNIGPLAAMPVMEGKAVLFKEFGGVNAFPICINAKSADEIVDLAVAVAPSAAR